MAAPLKFLQMVHLLCKVSRKVIWKLSIWNYSHDFKTAPFLHVWKETIGAMVKKITLLKSYFPFNYCIKFINTFCCWWNDPPLTFRFIIAAPLMRPQKMEMRPINMLRVKVTNRNSVRTLWVMFWYHWHSKLHGRKALQHKHLLNKQHPKRSKQKTTIPETKV